MHQLSFNHRFGLAPLLLIVAITTFAVDLNFFAQLVQKNYGKNAYSLALQLTTLVGQLKQASENEKLSQINHFFNRNIDYGEDIFVWNAKEYWASPSETIGRAAGDCEDFAISKYVFLKILGVSNEKLRLTYVKANYNGARRAHMVLSYYATPNAEPLILDNINPQIKRASNRPDLTPIFTFNDQGLWAANSSKRRGSASTHLSRWRDLLVKIQRDGLE